MTGILGLTLLGSQAFASPSAIEVIPGEKDSIPYEVVLNVSAVKHMSAKKAGFYVTVQTIVSEGSLNSNQLLVSVFASEEYRAHYLINTDLAAVGNLKLKWENTAGWGSNSGLYLRAQGKQENMQKKLEIKLTDSTGQLLDSPELNLN